MNQNPGNQKVAFYSACAVGMCAVFAALVAFHDGTGGGMAVLALSAVWFYNALTTMDNGLVRINPEKGHKNMKKGEGHPV